MFNSTSLAKFSNVDIGREYIHTNRTSKLAVKNLTMFPNFTNYMQNTEGCAFHESYEVEKNAIKFGGKTNSYVRLRTNIWKNDYSLKLDFRTSYPNGLVFVTVIFNSLLRVFEYSNIYIYIFRVVTNIKLL